MTPVCVLAAVLALTSVLHTHAQGHAEVLAISEDLYHSDLAPLLTRCDWAGEAIYRGGDPEGRWEDYQNSPSHAHVVNFPWTHHGEGRALVEDGQWVVVDVFCVASVLAPVVPIPTTTVPVTPILEAPPLVVAPTPTTTTTTTTLPPLYVPLGSGPPPVCDPSTGDVRMLCVA